MKLKKTTALLLSAAMLMLAPESAYAEQADAEAKEAVAEAAAEEKEDQEAVDQYDAVSRSTAESRIKNMIKTKGDDYDSYYHYIEDVTYGSKDYYVYMDLDCNNNDEISITVFGDDEPYGLMFNYYPNTDRFDSEFTIVDEDWFYYYTAVTPSTYTATSTLKYYDCDDDSPTAVTMPSDLRKFFDNGLNAVEKILNQNNVSLYDLGFTKRFSSTASSETDIASKPPTVSYRTYCQTYGWLSYVSNGATSGTVGEAKRLEGINVKLTNKPTTGGIRYRTYCQTYGWLAWSADDAFNGTRGEAKRLEAIQIELTGNLANYFDVYYRCQAQKFGWLGWAKNGAKSGTQGFGYRLEAIQIKIVKKGASAPGSTANACRTAVPATTVTMNKSSMDLTKGFSGTLSASMAPSNTTDTITWSSTNTAVAKVDSKGKVTAVGTGSCYIKATSTHGKAAACKVTVYKNEKTYNIDPNPNNYYNYKTPSFEAYRIYYSGNTLCADGYWISAWNYYTYTYVENFIFSIYSDGSKVATRTFPTYTLNLRANSYKTATIAIPNAKVVDLRAGNAYESWSYSESWRYIP